jgi:hypothetical protein
MDDAPTAGANAGAMIRGCMRDRRLQPAHRVWHQKWHLIGAEGTASSRAIFPSEVRHPSPAFLVSEPRLACQTSVGTDPKDCVTGSLANHAHRENIDAVALPAAHLPNHPLAHACALLRWLAEPYAESRVSIPLARDWFAMRVW